ncbi:MAG: hypothetical protein J2P46_09495 [Zavarzinella sp.]|nr:hypothetical protein [Zavarzinella sp.]
MDTLEDRLAPSTAQIKDIVPGAQGSDPGELTNVNGVLFFVASDPAHGAELWRSDGTAAGTVLVKDLNPGPAGSDPEWLTNVNGTLYFTARDQNGRDLWRSDGTGAGTVLVQGIGPWPDGLAPTSLTNLNGTLYFSATDGVNGRELWRSDGTLAGTQMVKDINPGPFGSDPASLTNVNGTLYFAAFDPIYGRELWRSDGTGDGTTLVKDIAPGWDSSNPTSLTNVNGTLFFAASDQAHGTELWKSERVDLSVQSVSLKPNDRPGTQPDGNVYFRYRVHAPVLDRDVKIAVFWGVGDNADIDLNNPVYPQSGATADVMKMTVKRGTKAGLSKALLRVPKAKLLVAPPGATSLVFVTDPENMRLPDGSSNPDWEGDRTEVNVSTDLTPDQLLKIMKRGGFQQLSGDDATRLAPLLANYMNQAGITSLERRAMFLAQAAVETDLLRQWAEAGSDNYFITNYWLAKGKWSGLGLSRPTRTGLSLRIPGATAAVPQKTFELYWSGGPTLDFSPTLIGSRVFKKVANWYEFEFDNTDAPPAHTTHLLVVDNSSGNPVVVSAIKNALGNWRVQDVLDFRGRGLLHLTGRANYQAFFDSGLAPPDLMNHPDLLSEKDTSPAYGIQSGVWYWSTQTDLNTVTDSFVGQRPYDFTFAVSKAINGINPSTKLPNGFPQRLKAYWGARSVLLVPPTPDDSPPLP